MPNTCPVERREPRLTLIELGLILGSVAVLPFGGPLGFGCALGGSAVVAKAIRRHRRPVPGLDPEERLRELRARRTPDAYLLSEVEGYVLLDALDHVRYRAVPRATLDDRESVIATLCQRGTPAEVERQTLPWRRIPHPLFAGFAGLGRVNGTSIVLFHDIAGPCLEDVGQLPRAQVQRLAAALFDGLEACAAHGLVLGSVPAGRLKLHGPTLLFAWKEPFDGGRCVVSPELGWEGLAPEQIATQESCPQTAQWQLGLLLYQALTGRHPFSGQDQLGCLMATLQQDPPPMGLSDPALEAFVLRLLAKDPAARYSSLAEARTAGLSLIHPASMP